MRVRIYINHHYSCLCCASSDTLAVLNGIDRILVNGDAHTIDGQGGDDTLPLKQLIGNRNDHGECKCV
jgi:hypothetical protein